jgi:transcriptional regulator with XRE-family HTH domain
MKYSSQKDVAFALGVTPEQVSRWKKQGCPVLKRPSFELDDINAW